MKPRVNVQSCIGYRMCFVMRGVVLWTSCDVEIVQDAACVCITGGTDNGGLGGKPGYIYICSGDFLVQGSTCVFCWLTNTKLSRLRLAAPPGTSWTSSLETRFSTRGEDSLQQQVLLWDLIPRLPLRPSSSRSKLSSSQVAPTVQPSITTTNA
jgi:hypothetical protein